MSQEKVYKILKELGGEATIKEIRKKAKEKYPKDSLYTYASLRLKQMEKWGIVKQIGDNTMPKWKIMKKWNNYFLASRF